MSFLAPIFFVLAGAIGLPLLFHLIRQRPQNKTPFSSFIFLQPSPKRLTRRSRLDDLFLLFVRALALLLIALAFMRPFYRSSRQEVAVADGEVRILVVDRSASMRRDGIWPQLQESIRQESRSLGPTDRLGIIAFDQDPEVILSPRETGVQPQTVEAILTQLQPTWKRADLGKAFVLATGMIEEVDVEQIASKRTIVLLSDQQTETDLAALNGFAWPESVEVRCCRLGSRSATNASLGVAAANLQTGLRVVVTNASTSLRGDFHLHWIDSQGNEIHASQGPALSLSVPAGSSRVALLPSVPVGAQGLKLKGDEEPFDNLAFFTMPKPISQQVLFLGERFDDPRDDLFYFLQQIDLQQPGRTIVFQAAPASSLAKLVQDPSIAAGGTLQPERVPLLIIHDFPPLEMIPSLEAYLVLGGRILVVLDSRSSADDAVAAGLRSLTAEQELKIAPTKMNGDAMLSRIDFTHPLFAPFADSRFADFTKIQFWRTQDVQLPREAPWKVLAWFDHGAPAIYSCLRGKGELFLLAAGWQPTESQFALSTKFVPLVALWIGPAVNLHSEQLWEVGQPLPITAAQLNRCIQVGGTPAMVELRDAHGSIVEAGVYQLPDQEELSSSTSRLFAVNLPKTERAEGTYDLSLLEQLGVRFTSARAESSREENLRQMQDQELEQQQQWWRMLLLAALALLLIETFWSLRRKRQSTLEQSSAPRTSLGSVQ